MTFDWRNLPDDDVERHFNPRNTVPDPQALLDGYARKSAETRNEIRGRYDLRYGKGGEGNARSPSSLRRPERRARATTVSRCST